MAIHPARLISTVCDRLQSWLPIIFLIAAGPLTAFLAVTVPPGETPDEVAHIIRADSVTHWDLAGFRQMGKNAQGSPEAQAAVWADVNLAFIGFGFAPGIPLAEKHVTLDHIQRLLHFGWQRRPLPVAASNTGVYPPTFYVPAAIALRVARGAKLAPYVALLVARLVNAVVYVGLGCAAISVARRGRVVLLCLLCLPMSLWLAASFNQDGLIIATAALSSALLTRQSRSSWWIGTVLLGLAAMAKPYLAVLGLILPFSYPGSLNREALGGLLTAIVPAALWTMAMSALVGVPFVRPPATPAGPLWTGPPGTLFLTTSPLDQLHILLASPVRLFTLPALSLWQDWEALWREFIGVLGTLDIILPEEMYDIWAKTIVIAIVASIVLERRRDSDNSSYRGILLNSSVIISLAISILAVYILQYLSWTRVGIGVCGRNTRTLFRSLSRVCITPVGSSPTSTLLESRGSFTRLHYGDQHYPPQCSHFATNRVVFILYQIDI